MEQRRLMLMHIPVIEWGKPGGKVYIHVNGKGGRKEDAGHFARIAAEKGYATISFDLPEHGERTDTEHRLDVWNGVRDLDIVADYAYANYSEVCLYACSLGAYFSLECYGARKIGKCLFQSPIVDMRLLAEQMMSWFGITLERLEREKEIATPIDPLRWDYYRYACAHPVESWPHPTAILYGGRDDLQPREVMERFAARFGCALTVSEQSEHAFMHEQDGAIVENWLRENV